MNNKGMAISSILYTILVLFLVLLFGILGLISSAKTTFDTLKNKLLTDLNDTKPRVTAVEDDFVDNKIIVSVFSRKYISSYYISQSVDTLSRDAFNANSNKQDLTYPTGSFKVDYMKQNNNQYYIYLKDIHDNVYSYPIRIEQNNNCGIPTGMEYTFDYTGNVQTFEVPCTGAYKLEAWGAMGGTSGGVNGYGGYSTGTALLNSTTPIYVVVGGQGQSQQSYNSVATGGYNGGGNGGDGGHYSSISIYSGGAGGGATHIAKVSGTLASIGYNSFVTQGNGYIVAGGGGGASSVNGGSGGGYVGVSGAYSSSFPAYHASGGTQTTGGIDQSGENNCVAGTFGQGSNFGGAYGGAGGGGGLYGGGGSNRNHAGAGGGSGYIGKDTLTDKAMYCFACTEDLTHENTFTVSTIGTSTYKDSVNCPNGFSSNPISKCAKYGDGYAKITLVSASENGFEYQIISDSLDNKSRMTSLAGSTTTFSIKVRSYNSGNTKYELYYKSSNNDVVVTSVNEVTGTIQENETKTIKVTVKNTGSESTIVRFYVAGSTTRENPTIDGKEIISSVSDCQYATGYTWDFDYTGNIQTFEAPCTGTYKLETWGAQGGGNTTYIGGYGAYSTGNIALSKNNNLYIVVGEAGRWSTTDYEILPSTYNGGGPADSAWSSSQVTEWHGSGGGATHIAKVTGTLSSIGYQSFVTNNNGYMVAAGGGGAGYFVYTSSDYVIMQGGHGGGINGSIGDSTPYGGFGANINNLPNTPATQTSASTIYYTTSYSNTGSFGQAGTTYSYIGGGSGLYGGAGMAGRSSGGSSYIGNSKLTNKKMVCYNCTTSTNANTYTVSNTCTSATPTANCSKQGNGYARITYLGKSTETLAAKVLIDNPVVKTNPTLTTTATTSAESGLYSMNVNNGFSGENGKSYYFRGVVNNNYVSFAGKTWRIVRINEDGTVRLILDEDMDANTYTMNNVYTGASQMYFSNTNMQGTPEHPNARYALNDWYNNNIGNNATHSNKVTNSQQNYFCEEAKIVYSNTENVYSGTTFMKVLDNTYTPNFECNKDQNNHQYVNTNIGLLTIDEMLLAGGHTSASNPSFYLSKSYLWWLMSPGGVTADQIGVSWAMTSNGTISVTCVHRDFMKLRPVINLKYNVEVTGSGTSSNPYVVKNN